MKLKVIVHEAEEGGYWAEVPAIPGCATQGDTFEELLSNLYEAPFRRGLPKYLMKILPGRGYRRVRAIAPEALPACKGTLAAGGAPSGPWIMAPIRAGVSGRSRASAPSASATALARQTGVVMQLPSPTPLAPSGVTGLGESRCRMSGSGTSHAVGTR